MPDEVKVTEAGTLDGGVDGVVPKDMFEILVNGVFAFAMTLIVKNNIYLPPSIPTDELAFFTSYISNLINDGLSFLFMFMILAIFYILFFEIIRQTRVIDRVIVCFTFAFLLSILFIPLTSFLWALSDEPLPYGVLFHANILISGLLIFILWRLHISTVPALRLPGMNSLTARNLSLRLLLFPATAVVGLLLDSSELSFSVIPIMASYLVPGILFVYLSRDNPVPAEPDPGNKKRL